MLKYSEIKVGIIVARFNEIITSKLAQGAKSLLLRRGINPLNIFEVEVPGSFELPLASQMLIDQKNVHGVIALGAVIRGNTSHYDYVCSGTTSGLMTVQLSRSTPISFGVLTCETMEQAIDRAGGKLGNKGSECADALLDMISLKSTDLGSNRV
jgi:6,7-dimethyl-8-ribityllumazine synthase